MRAVLALLVLLATTQVADAGRTHFGWLYGTEVLPTRGVEIQTWVYEKNGTFDGTLHDTLMWWGVLVGVNEHLELAFPTEFLWRDVEDDVDVNGTPIGANFTIEKFGIEARYRFTDLDPEHPDGFTPLLRVAAKRDVVVRDVTILEGDLVLSQRVGKFLALADLGITSRVSRDGAETELRPGGGISFEVTDELRLGAEAYAELPLDDALNKTRWAGVGPNISWTHGRFWISGSFLVGIYQIDTAPRVLWGILF